ncbi:rCG26620 [Rattus norvegicus]|uniref:RCG26620 n=1 Tax=Rattus norvegicus TaxID=10116 RepID=A6HNI3_RAT|nr:rCG26620 [Rattus norvegicus]
MCQYPGRVGCLLNPVEGAHSLPCDLSSCSARTPHQHCPTCWEPREQGSPLHGSAVMPRGMPYPDPSFFWHRLPGILGTVEYMIVKTNQSELGSTYCISYIQGLVQLLSLPPSLPPSLLLISSG